MFSHWKKQQIAHAFEKYATASNPQALPKALLSQAASGVLVNDRDRARRTKKQLLDKLQDISSTNFMVNDDSTSAWMYIAITKFGLNAGDIRNMTFGQEMRVLFMDRNVGDYTDNSILKAKFDPSVHIFMHGTYVHGEGLTGLLRFDNGVIHAPFDWEVNMPALLPAKASNDDSPYWCPLDSCQQQDVPDDILVGWRGPAIDMVHMSELPSFIRVYGTWWDDYGVNKYHDWKRHL